LIFSWPLTITPYTSVPSGLSIVLLYTLIIIGIYGTTKHTYWWVGGVV
jgi:hypothetical protein